MFKESQRVRQINMDDPYHSFPKYVREALHNSWAEFFFEHIFRNIMSPLVFLVGKRAVFSCPPWRQHVIMICGWLVHSSRQSYIKEFHGI